MEAAQHDKKGMEHVYISEFIIACKDVMGNLVSMYKKKRGDQIWLKVSVLDLTNAISFCHIAVVVSRVRGSLKILVSPVEVFFVCFVFLL